MADRTPAADLGRLRISDRVIERVAAIAASGVDGVVSSGSGLDQLLGHRYPNVTAHVAGRRARLSIQVAVAWPYALAEVTADVRREVREQLSELVGITADPVDVAVAQIVHVDHADLRRVR